MIELLRQIEERLRSSAYVNEASITHGIVTPILKELGWDTADPKQVMPEFANARGRVDFALIGLGQRPSIFIEVKQVGRATEGDRQLFEYAFHQKADQPSRRDLRGARQVGSVRANLMRRARDVIALAAGDSLTEFGQFIEVTADDGTEDLDKRNTRVGYAMFLAEKRIANRALRVLRLRRNGGLGRLVG